MNVNVIEWEFILVWVFRKRHIPLNSIVYLSFWTLEVFVRNTTYESCIKVTVLVCEWRQDILSKSKYQNRMFPMCSLDIPYFGQWWINKIAVGGVVHGSRMSICISWQMVSICPLPQSLLIKGTRYLGYNNFNMVEYLVEKSAGM